MVRTAGPQSASTRLNKPAPFEVVLHSSKLGSPNLKRPREESSPSPEAEAAEQVQRAESTPFASSSDEDEGYPTLEGRLLFSRIMTSIDSHWRE